MSRVFAFAIGVVVAGLAALWFLGKRQQFFMDQVNARFIQTERQIPRQISLEVRQQVPAAVREEVNRAVAALPPPPAPPVSIHPTV